ncbi:MAG: AsmA family protein [Hydrogenovibrio sp.]|uniref:AsmA family protein n=1 Tax=Hydrogenovibrio sp. TaxID=2065821 RepID=UPI00286FC7C8|nr:AsmA family protein [Hydrogenovibrio sp.]MDR9498286.1 AsmA family protein [Hydrogenovibrio sp.]
MTEPTETTTEQATTDSRAKRHLKGWAKWSHRLIYVGILLPVMLVLGFAGAVHFMDFNQYKPQLESEFQKRTGYALSVEGEVGVSVWPFSLSVETVTVASPDGFEQPLAEIDQAEVTLSLWALFVEQRLKASGVELIGPRLNLIEKAGGQRNYQPLVARLAPVQASLASMFQSPSSSPLWMTPGSWVIGEANAATTDTATSESWDLEALIVRDGVLTWQSPQGNLALKHLSLMAYDLMPERPSEVMLSGQLASSGLAFQTQLDARGQMVLTNGMQSVTLNDWQADLRLQPTDSDEVPPLQATFKLAQAQLDREKDMFHVKQAALLSVLGRMEASGSGPWPFQSGKPLAGSLSMDRVNVRQWARHTGLNLPRFQSDQALTDVSLTLQGQWQGAQWSLEEVVAKLDQASLEGWMRRDPDGRIRFDWQGADWNLDHYQAWLKPRSQDSAAPDQATEENGKENGNSASDSVSDAVSPDAKAQPRSVLPVGLPIKGLRTWQVEGDVALTHLRHQGVSYDEVRASVQSESGRWHLQPFMLRLYQGQIETELTLDVSGETPVYTTSGQISDVAMQPLMTDAWEQSRLSGDLFLQFQLASKGVNPQLLKQNATGRFEGEIRDGAYHGMDLNRLLSGQSAQPGETRFESLNFAAPVKDGVVDWETLAVTSERFSAQGSGNWDWGRGEVSMRFDLNYDRPPKGLAMLEGLSVPVTVAGPTDQMVWQAPLDKLLQTPDNQKKLLDAVRQLLN